MKSELKNIVQSEKNYYFFISIIYGILSILLIILLFFFGDNSKYVSKVIFSQKNIILFISSSAILIIFLWLFKPTTKINNFFENHSGKIVIIGTLIVFILQLLIYYNTYFYTGWDAGEITTAATNYVNGNNISFINNYLSMYPNNILLLFIEIILLKCGMLLGTNSYMILVGFNCLISCLTGIIIYSSLKIIASKKLGLFAWGIFIIFIAFSPWNIIPYSDTFALIIPISLFRIYLIKTKNNIQSTFKWFSISFLAFLGFNLKPQTFIFFIAIIIISIIKLVFNQQKNVKKLAFIMLSIIFAFAAFQCVYKPLPNFLHLEIDKQQNFGIPHWFMMGMNAERDGVFSQKDVDASKGIFSSKERAKFNLKTGFERIRNEGFIGTSKLIAKKSLVNYNDGTFAWAQEGNFYNKEIMDKNETISPFIKDIYYSNRNSSKHNYFKSYLHSIWLTIFVGTLSIFIYLHKSNNLHELSVLLLSLIGLFIFLSLFEARSRYLYTYVPVYIVVFTLGVKNVYILLHKKFKSKKA